MAEALAVVDMLDAIGARGPAVIPKGTRRVAAYITGSGGIAWTNSEIAALAAKGVQLVLRIDQTNQFLPFLSVKDLVVDIEPGAATNLTADSIDARRAQAGQDTVDYCMVSDFDALKASVNARGLQNRVWYWVADWNLDRQGAIDFLAAHDRVVAVQWASPTSNPSTLVPGSNATLAQANVDLSVTRAGWPDALPANKHVLPKPKPLPKPHVKITAAGISGALTAALVAYLNSHGVHVTHLSAGEASAISLTTAVLAGYLVPAK